MGENRAELSLKLDQQVKDGVQSPAQSTVPRTHSDLGASRLRYQERLRLILTRFPRICCSIRVRAVSTRSVNEATVEQRFTKLLTS